MLNTNVHTTFLDLFYPEIKDKQLHGNNKLNLHTLKVINNDFAYDELVEALGNHLHFFALSRKEVDQLLRENKHWNLIQRAKERLRNHTANNGKSQTEGGELGEILLYCFLESHLNAPKILTKLELKTSSQMFVHGADGVHLLKVDDKNYQLIFGEAKLIADLGDGISKAFSSISNLLEEKGKKKKFELQLVSSQLIKETYDDESLYEFLKKVIVPSAKDDETNIDHSFGIFLGFDIEVTSAEKSMSNSEFRTYLRTKIVDKVEESIASINRQIQKTHLSGYNFYIYVIPFTDLENNRKTIIEGLL